MSGIDLEITLQDQKLIASLLRAAGAQKQFTGEVDKTKASAAKAEKELDRMAESVKKMTATPLEKYNSELKRLEMLQQKNKISAEDHRRAVEKLHVTATVVGTEMTKSAAAAGKLGSVGKASMMEIAGAMGLVTSASGIATVAINQIVQGLQHARQQAKEAASETKSLSGSRANLVQISSGDPAKFAKLEADAKRLEDQGIPRKNAREFVFAANSEGWQGELEQVARAHQVVPQHKELSQVAGQIPGMYAAHGVKLGNLEAVNLTMKAAEQSRLDFAPMGTAMVQAAEGGAAAGTSPTELAAMAGLLAVEYKSGDVAAQRISSFGADIAKTDDLRGLGHLGAFRKIRDEYTPEQRESWLGNDQSKNNFYLSMLRNEGEIVKRTAELDQGQKEFKAGGGVIRKQISLTEANAGFGAQRATQIEENQRDRVKEDKLALHGLSVEGGIAKNERVDLEANRSPVARFASKQAADAAAVAGFSGKLIPVAGRVAGSMVEHTGELNPGGGGSMAMVAKVLLDAAHALKDAATSQGRNNQRNMQADAMAPVN